MIQDLLLQAISHERMRQKLHDLNCYFYNRKHETQIRDELTLIINKISNLTALSEHPKCRAGAVDLSIYDSSIPESVNGAGIATIEIKHHYPKDLVLPQVKRDIALDISRVIFSPTTHFIHILQQRTLLERPSFGRVKYSALQFAALFKPFASIHGAVKRKMLSHEPAGWELAQRLRISRSQSGHITPPR